MTLATQYIQQKRATGFPNPFYQPDNVGLAKIISEMSSNDPSMRSLSYLRMTSRKGLFVFEGEFGPILFSKHPNSEDTYIVYPPKTLDGYKDILSLAQILKAAGNVVEVIRIPEQDAERASSILNGKVIEEKRLDFIYPVHIMETSTLKSMQGTKFLKFRNKVNAIRKTNVLVRGTSFSHSDITSMQEIVQTWAPLLFKDNIAGETDYILYALKNIIQLPRMQGLIVFQDEKPCGFTIWENPAGEYDTANSLVHCALHERGMSELLHHEMAKILDESGIKYLSLGGAESEGLDAFKRKMNPVKSIRLKTISV